MTRKTAVILLCFMLFSFFVSCSGDSGKTAATTTGSTVALPESSKVESGEENGFTYDLYKHYVEITGYTGAATEITIPPVIAGTVVMSVGKSAFDGNEKIEAVYFPEGLTNIGNYSFRSCINLKKVKYPSTLISIGNYSFQRAPLTEITIPEGVTNIGKYAFGETLISEITIPNSIVKIGDYAFHACQNLTTFIIPSHFTVISKHMFSGCSSLTEVIVPDFITELDDYAFSACSSLTKIHIGSNVTEMGEGVLVNSTDAVVYTPAGSAAEKYCITYKVAYQTITEE